MSIIYLASVSVHFQLYVSEQWDSDENEQTHMIFWAFTDHICHKNQQSMVPAHMRLWGSWFHAWVQAVFKKEHKHCSFLCVACRVGAPDSRR